MAENDCDCMCTKISRAHCEAKKILERTPLTAANVAACVARIAFIGDDDAEAAHGLEDEMRGAVLSAIASGSPHAADLAAEALKTNGLGFARRCA